MSFQDSKQSLSDFIQQKIQILLTSDSSIQEVNGKNICLVINAEIPKQQQQFQYNADCIIFQHRVGRTGRFGDCGVALNLITKNQQSVMDEIKKKFNLVAEKDIFVFKDDYEYLKKQISDTIEKTRINNETIQKMGQLDQEENKQNQENLMYLYTDASWEDVGFPEDKNKYIYWLIQKNFFKPSPVQFFTISTSVNRYQQKQGLTLLCQSPNGSGKTLSYIIPSILIVDLEMQMTVKEKIKEKGIEKEKVICAPQVIIIEPTLELVNQVENEFKKVIHEDDEINCCNAQQQLSDCHILLGTIKKITNYIKNNKVSLSQCKIFAVDEVDNFLNSNFRQDLLKLYSQKNETFPKYVQFFLLSATIPDNDKLKDFSFDKDPNYIRQNFQNQFQQNSENAIPNQLMIDTNRVVLLEKYLQESPQMDNKLQKQNIIFQILSMKNNSDFKDKQMIVFFNDKNFLIQTYTFLKQSKGVQNATVVHGDLSPQERNQNIEDFGKQKYKILLTTNVLARGYDERNICLVLNADLPLASQQNTGNIDLKEYNQRCQFIDENGVLINLLTNQQKDVINEIKEEFKLEFKKNLFNLNDNLNENFSLIKNLIQKSKDF